MPAFRKHFITVCSLTDSHTSATQRIAVSTMIDLTICEASLVPRPYPAFQCFTLKNGRAWYAKSRALHDVINALMNVGVQTTPPTQRVSAKTTIDS